MPVIKHADQRVGVFIDTQNLYHSAKNLYSAKVDFGAVLTAAVSGRLLVKAIAYVVSTENGDEKVFFDALNHKGIETKSKDLQVFSGGVKKGDWDVGMAIDVVKNAPKLDAVILATADGDFVPLVEYLQAHGCQVEIIAFGRSTSQKLRERADDFIDMDEDLSSFLIQNPYRNSRDHHNEKSSTTYSNNSFSLQNEKIIDTETFTHHKKRGRPKKS